MPDTLLVTIGSASILLWGIAHLFPTRNIVKDFGDISTDNKRIITMEWIIEGIALIFIGTLLLAVTFIGEKGSKTATLVYISSFLMMVILAVISLFTGARIKFLPFRLCPIIFSTSALLILLGMFL